MEAAPKIRPSCFSEIGGIDDQIRYRVDYEDR